MLKRDYKRFEGSGAYVHQHGEHVPTWMRSLSDKIGFFSGAKYNADTQTIDAELVLAKTPKAEALKSQIDLDLASNNSMVQLSAVYSFSFTEKKEKRKGKDYYVVKVDSIDKVFSVDFVDTGAFPMRPLQKLTALSESWGDFRKENDMAEEKKDALKPEGEVTETPEVEQETKVAELNDTDKATETVTMPEGEGDTDVTALTADIEELRVERDEQKEANCRTAQASANFR